MAGDEEVDCTLVMNDKYLPGAAVLAKSLRDAGATRKLAVLVTLDSIEPDTLTELKSLYDHVIPVDRIANNYPRNLYIMDRPDLLYTFTKINLWRQTQFKKIVYIDADVLAIRAPDELFYVDAVLAAAPDIGWPDIFNSGVLVLKPDMGDFYALQGHASSGDSFDGADQGLLNQYFEHRNWHRLSFRYNCTPSANYQYEPAHRYYKSTISMVHYISGNKPWIRGRAVDHETGTYRELLNSWWAVYDRHYRVAGQGTSGTSGVVQRYTNDHLAIPEPEALVNTTEPQLTDLADPVEELVLQDVQPVPTAEQRRQAAPWTEWDATRAPPPAESHPEAANFPNRIYEFNNSTSLFQAPKPPEPPKNLSYQIPRQGAHGDQPKAIFPWEEREQVRPSRVFAEDFDHNGRGFASPDNVDARPEPSTPRITVSLDDGTAKNDKISRNAWDDIAEIDDYVRKYSQMQKLRGSLQVLSGNDRMAQSPTEDEDYDPLDRKASMVVTDFPSAQERPSLPVTPAPIRRHMFWGSERSDRTDLPSAKGVPSQVEWDPASKLEELRQMSLNMDPKSMILPSKNVPKRDLPQSSVLALAGASPSSGPEHHVHFGGVSESPTPKPGPASGSVPLRSKPSFDAGPLLQHKASFDKGDPALRSRMSFDRGVAGGFGAGGAGAGAGAGVGEYGRGSPTQSGSPLRSRPSFDTGVARPGSPRSSSGASLSPTRLSPTRAQRSAS